MKATLEGFTWTPWSLMVPTFSQDSSAAPETAVTEPRGQGTAQTECAECSPDIQDA